MTMAYVEEDQFAVRKPHSSRSSNPVSRCTWAQQRTSQVKKCATRRDRTAISRLCGTTLGRKRDCEGLTLTRLLYAENLYPLYPVIPFIIVATETGLLYAENLYPLYPVIPFIIGATETGCTIGLCKYMTRTKNLMREYIEHALTLQRRESLFVT